MTDSSSFSDAVKRLAGARVALLVAALLLVAMAFDTAPQRWLRAQLFDAYQQVLPRQRASQPAMVVAIDGRSLDTVGQWPWPRTKLAELIDRIAAAQPVAVGVDIFMPEPDRTSPRRVLEAMPRLDPALRKSIEALPDNDEILAAALKGRPIAMAVSGDDDPAHAPTPDRPIRAAPVLVRGDASGVAQIHEYAGAIRSRPGIEAAATGQGLINNLPSEDGVVRRVPLLGRIGDRLVPNLEVDMVRLAEHQPLVQALVDRDGVRELRVAHTVIPTDRDGAVWLRYGAFDAAREVSATDVLAGKVDPVLLQHRFVLIGLTGLGLVDQPVTPLGTHASGIEIRQQLLENIFDRTWLVRPEWTPFVESVLFVAMALVFLLRVIGGTPAQAFALYAGVITATGVAGLIAFNVGALLDVATPIAAATLVFTLALGNSLAETQRQRKELAQRLQAEREAAARLAGELETARRVQMGMLPESPGPLAGDPRVDLKAFMEPARSVGGDLYDFFLLDRRRLFVMIGDVSGKGLAAAMFMALIKSLCKSAVLRLPDRLEQALAEAEDEIKRENPESLFVTMLVLCLDLDTGEFTYCNAGHDPLYSVSAESTTLRKIDHGGRPPLCVLDDYPYPLGHDRLAPGEAICMITDGITEAATASGQLYGHKRLEAALLRVRDASAATIVESLRQDVLDFAAGAEQADDMSVVALRWRGPAPA